ALHLIDGEDAGWTIDAFAPVRTRSLVTQVAVPAEVKLLDTVFGMQLGGSSALTLLPVRPPSTSETIERVPDLPGAAFILAALGAPPGKTALNTSYSTARVASAPGDSAKMAIGLESPIALVGPAHGAIVARDDDFAWEASGSRPALVR